MFLGYFPIVDSYQLTFYFQFVNTTGSAANPTSPTWRMYEQASGTVVTNSTLTQLDSGTPILGLYYGQVTIASGTGTGMEDDKEYVIRGTGTVDTETPAGIHVFRTGYAPANARAISGDVSAADNLESMLDATGSGVLSLKQLNVINSSGNAIVAQSTGGNGHGLFLDGQGSGNGLFAKGGGSSAAAIALSGNNGGGAQVFIASASDAAVFSASGGGAGMTLTGASGINGYGLRIQGSTGITDAEGVFIGGGDGKDAIVIQGGNFSGNAAGIRITGTGTQAAIELQGGATSGPGFRSTGGAGGSGPGVDFVGGTGGHGVRSTGGSGGSGAALLGGLNGRGLLAQAQSGNAAGIESIGVGTGAGFRSLGGTADGDGVQFQAQGSGNAIEALVVSGKPLSQNIEDQLVDGVWAEIVPGAFPPNSAGAVLASISPAAIADAVWDEILGARAAGSAGRLVTDAYKIMRNRLKIDGVANTMTIYDDDEVTPLFVYNTKDSLGGPSTTTIFERDPV